jgi:stage V sporulation protein AD
MSTHTIPLKNQPCILGWGSAVGKKEGEGPLGNTFGQVFRDTRAGQETWEEGESTFQHTAMQLALERAKLTAEEIGAIFGGDLLNQCVSTSCSLKEFHIPFFGLYGACSTMAEGLGLAALLCDGGYVQHSAAITSSHFCTSERQFRTPLEYGGQRTPTAQWTATAAGAVILGRSGSPIRITHVTVGQMVDRGIKDVNNMGAAMAPAVVDTLLRHFHDTGRKPEDYDLIVTGDLGRLGKELVIQFTRREGLNLGENYDDCGVRLFDPLTQDVHCGGSGCGCSAAVLCGQLLSQLEKGELKRLLFCGTGALHSTLTLQQGKSIPGICHAVAIEVQEETP